MLSATEASPERGSSIAARIRETDQGHIVGVLDLVLIVIFVVFIPGFGSFDNVGSIASASAGLGVLALGQAIVVIGRGIDLSVVAIYGVTGQFFAQRLTEGSSEWSALIAGLVMAVAFGCINGLLVAFVEVPPLFVTLATSLAFIGLSRVILFDGSISFKIGPDAQVIHAVGNNDVFGLPLALFVWLGIALVAWTFLARSVPGRMLYAIGDKPEAAALVGMPTRPLTLLAYVASAVLSFVAGLIIIGGAGSFDSRLLSNGSQLYDVLAIVVIGGVSLAGGRGTVEGVITATVLIGILLNAMTLLDLDTVQQSIFKAVIVIFALVLDRWLHPVDEETARSGEL
jgi:ribose transport system permease protein